MIYGMSRTDATGIPTILLSEFQDSLIMAQTIPAEVSAAGLEDWYSGLNDPTRVKLKRYLAGIDTSSPVSFLRDLMARSYEDHNYGLSIVAGEYSKDHEMDDYTRFLMNEGYIDGLFGADRFDEAKQVCCENLDMFPSIKDRFLEDNGGSLPKAISCRNRLIDMMVGVDSDYDGAYEALDMFVAIGILDQDELDYRKQSLKIHRLQKSFDNLFMYRPKDQE